MLENITASAVQPRNNNVFTVIWQGINVVTVFGDPGEADQPPIEDATDFATEVVPAEWGHISIDSITRKEWGHMACGEETDGNNPYDTIEVLHIIEGGVILLDPAEDEDDVHTD